MFQGLSPRHQESSRQESGSDSFGYVPLESGARLEFAAPSCLSVRFPDNCCGLCADACPVGALKLAAGRPRLGRECIGCGQCATVCPTAALQVQGFGIPSTLPAGAGDTISIDCWRVPISASPTGAIRVPCLGGITIGWLLALFDAAASQGERGIQLLDRHACSTCPAAAGMPELQAVVKEVRNLLSCCGVPADTLPEVGFAPASELLLPAIPSAAAALPMPRRGFLQGLVGSAARTADDVHGALAPVAQAHLRSAAIPLERLRTIRALTNIASRHGIQPPQVSLPQMSIAACHAHGVCAAVCPTTALRRHAASNEGEAGLSFDANLCVSCGQCALVCPDRAIRLAPVGGRGGRATIVTWPGRKCAACGDVFHQSGEDVCPGCRKIGLLQKGLAELFRPSS